jgi:N12 class adenine-specific DNA methylase
MAEINDLSDLGAKVPTDRSLTNAADLSDIGTPDTPPKPAPTWKSKPFDAKQLDLSDLATSQEPVPKSYSMVGNDVHFSVDRPYDGLRQAVNDGVLDPSFAEKNGVAFQEAQVRRQDVIDAAGSGAVAKALLHGGGRGAAFLAAAPLGAKMGGAAGVAVVGGPEDPAALITGPIGSILGGLTTGTIASIAAGKAMEKAADYNSAIRSLVASSELHPMYDAAGELISFAASAPKSIANLVKLGRVATAAGQSATKVVGAQLLKGAAAGAAFEGVVRPAFDYGRYFAADQLGISHDKFEGPGLSSLAQNVALGLLTAGHNIQFKDYPGADVANIVLRAKAREAAGIPLDQDDPAGVIKGFENLGADQNADLQKNGLLVPLNAGEMEVYVAIKGQMDKLRDSGVLDDKQVASLSATQATTPGFGKNKAPITSAVIGLKEKEKTNAANPEQQQESVQPKRLGTDEVGQTQPETGAGNRVPSATGKPAIPEEVAKEIGFTFNPKSEAGGVNLQGLPPEVAAQFPKMWEFTFPGQGPLYGATFYVPQGASREDILKRAQEVTKAFTKAATPPPVTPPVTLLPQQMTSSESEELSALRTKDRTEDGLTKDEEKRFFELSRKETASKRAAKTNTLASALKEAGVTAPANFLHPSDGVENHIESWTRDSNGFIQIRVETHTSVSMSSKLITVKPGDTLSVGMNDAVKGTTRYEESNPTTRANESPVDAEPPPVPETPATINAQVKMLTDGKRDAILITPGEAVPAVPEGHAIVKTAKGMVVYNPTKVDRKSIIAAANNDTLGTILGYGTPAKPAPGTEVGAVVVRSPEGVEKQGVLTDKESLPAVTAAAEKVASPGDKITIEPEKEVIAKRASGRSLRSKKPTPIAEDDPRIPDWQRTADRVGVSLEQWMDMATLNDKEQMAKYGTTRAKLMEAAALGSPTKPTAEKEANESESRQDVVAGAGQSGGTVAGEAGGAADVESVRAVSQPTGGNDVGIPPTVEGSEATEAGSGDRRVEPTPAGPDQPGPESGQPPVVEPPLQPTPEPVQIPTRAIPDKPKTDDPNAENHVIRAEDTIAPAGKVGKLKANIEAIMLLKRLEEDNRNATPEEKRTLAQYTGWGSVSQVFDNAKGSMMEREAYYGRDDKWEKQWGKYYTTLHNLLTEEEWDAAARSTQYAHFTSRTVVSKMWEMAERLGFSGGNILEPAAGVGNFFGLTPEALGNVSRFVGIEQDALSGRLLTKIYPQARVFIKGFEDVSLPANSIDLAITNVPFSPRIIADKNYPKLNTHDYFIAKMLDSVKPGGLVITITSAHTMDSQAVMRQYLASRGELIGAIRLPNTAFKENAGTEVTTDILVLRKPMTPTPTAGHPWTSLKQTQTHDGKPLMINEYFVDHPSMVLGKLSLEGTMRGGEEEFTLLPFEDKEIGPLLDDALKLLPADIYERAPSQMVDFAAIGAAGDLKDNTLTLKEGTLAVAKAGAFVDPITINELFKHPEVIEQGKQYIGLRDKYRGLLEAQTSAESTEKELDAARKKLNALYDEYVKKYGFLNAKKNDFLEFEQSYYLLMGLEREFITKGATGRPVKTYTKADVFSRRTQFPRIAPNSAANLKDAVQVSLSYQGRVDSEYIGRLVGSSTEKAEDEMLDQSLVFRNPETGLLETPERYLSGNVRRKLERAKTAAESDDKFKSNVEALTKVIPADVPFRQIRARIGSTWIPAEVMVNFARDLFGSARGGIKYIEAVDKWVVGGFNQTPAVKQTYATGRFDGEELLSYALNQKSPVVYDTIEDGDTTRRVFNQVETTKAGAAIDKMQLAFQGWLRKNAEVQVSLERKYNDEKNHSVETNWAIDRLDLPGASDDIILRANQREAVFRYVQEGHGVIAQGVGSGKTFELIAVAMESKRLKLANKPMIAVKNSTLGQFANAFRKLYPGANILIASKDDLVKEKRKLFLSRIASGNYDSIIIPHSQLDMLQDDPVFETEMIRSMLDELEDAIRAAREASGSAKDPTVKELEKQKEKFEDKLKDLAERKKEDVITFQQLGVDMLMIDELHEYKKPPFITKLDRVAGLERQSSKRAYSLLIKARWIQSRNNGRGIIGATGTPITNTLGETWHMLNITSPHLLKEYGVDTFDKFVSTFALISQKFDVNATGKLVLKNRLATFVNGPELIKLIRASWSILTQDQLRRVIESQGEAYPKLEGGKVESVIVEKTDAVAAFNSYLLDVYDTFKNLDGKAKKEYSYIPVLTFLAGKAAALDIRLVKRMAADDPGSKVNKAVGNIFDIWQSTKADRLTQAVFLDSFNPLNMASINAFLAHEEIEVATDKEADEPEDYTPAEDLFLFKDIKRKLMALGVPENEILIVNEFDVNKPEASLLFEQVNSGEKRIVLGSTAKMGVGVNIQKRLYALHHLDTPWFPALLEQRNGRIERPGNMNKTVRILYYGMSGTIDAGLYAKNEAKAKFNQQIMSGASNAREFEDPVGPMIATLQEQMASLSGDPLLVEKVLLESRIRTLTLERDAFEDDQAAKAYSARTLQYRIDSAKKDLVLNGAMLEKVEPLLAGEKVQGIIGGRSYAERKDIIEAMQALVQSHVNKIRKLTHEKFYNIDRRGNVNITDGRDESLRLGTVNGIAIEIGFLAYNKLETTETVVKDDKGVEKKKQDKHMVTHVDVHYMNATVPVAGADQKLPIGYPTTAEGLMRAIPNVPSEVKAQIANNEKTIVSANQELAEIATLLQQTFPNAEELQKSQDRYAALQDEVIKGGDVAVGGDGTATTKTSTADMLFSLGIDPIPLLIKLHNAVEDVSNQLENEINLRERAAARRGLVQTDEERQAAVDEYDERDAKINVLSDRLQDLQKRLNVVEKARLESELSGESTSMPYGLTPASRPGIAYDSSIVPSTVGDEMKAQGIEHIRQILSHPLNGLSSDARRVALDLLDTPVMSGLDWTKLGLSLVNNIEGGYAGMADIQKWLIEISKQASSTTFPHEVFHFLFAMLPDADQIRIDDLRKAELKAKYGDDADKRLVHGTMTSDEAIAAGIDDADYYLINPSEYLAKFASEKFARESFQQRNDAVLETLWHRIVRWLRGLLDSIKRIVGLKPDMDHIVRDILAGKNVSNLETAQEFEHGRQGQPEEQPKPEPEPIEDAGISFADLDADISAAEAESIKEGNKTEVLGRIDTILGREKLDAATRAAGEQYAEKIFTEAGLQVTLDQSGLWKLLDPHLDSEIEGRHLYDILEREIAAQQQKRDEKTGHLGNLLTSVAVYISGDYVTAFSKPLKNQLYAIAQGERSHRGVMMAVLGGFGKTVDYVARNVDVVLYKTYSDSFGGDAIRSLMERVLTDFRDYFTDEEIEKTFQSEEGATDAINKILNMSRRDEGGRVYRKAQALLKPKNKKKLAQLEADARVKEAVDYILESLKKEGIEPKPSPNKPLLALERLLLMVQPKTAGKINAAIANAVKDAERNAGIKAALDAATDDDEREDLQGRFAAGEEPDKDMVEAGLTLPQFAHWKVLRDTLLDYSPTTVKLAQDLIRGDFKGTVGKAKAIVRDTRLDLRQLATQPEAEIEKVINNYLQNLDNNMDLRSASPDTKQRILSMVEQELTAQIEAARQKYLNRQFAEPKIPGAVASPEEQLGKLFHAGLLADPRLDIPGMVERVANKTGLQRLMPKMADLVRSVLETPFYHQDDLRKNFVAQLISKLGVDEADAENAGKLFAAAFSSKFAEAKKNALKKASEGLTPRERKPLNKQKGTWRKLEEAVNAGVFDSGPVLEAIAAANGWTVPDEAYKARMRSIGQQIQQLRELSDKEKAEVGTDAKALADAQRVKEAATFERRIALKKQFEGLWSRVTNPFSVRTKPGRQNIMRAISEFTPANLLFKVGFAPRLAIDILTQGATHAPSRAIAEAFERWTNDRSAGRTASLWRDIAQALNDSRKAWAVTFTANLAQSKEALAGRGEARNVDRLLSRIAFFERNAMAVEEHMAKGEYAQAAVTGLIHMVGFSFRIAQMLDTFQGLPAEWMEMRNGVVTALRENGMTRAEAAMKADDVIGDFRNEWTLAIATARASWPVDGPKPKASQVKSAAVQIVKAQAYARIQELGLLPDDFEEQNRILRNTLSWGEREEGGIGGAIAGGMRWTGKVGERIGFPLGIPFVTLTRFSNAIGTGINYKLMHTPLGFFPSTFDGSPWARTDKDRRQMQVRAAIGSLFGLAAFMLAYYGLLKYQARPPIDKEERDLWEREGHRANTVEIQLGDGSFIPVSTIIGPLAMVSPYIAAGGKLNELINGKEKQQQKLNDEAARRGVEPGKVDPLSATDYLSVAAEAAWNAVLGSRTAAGLSSTVTEYGTPNLAKVISGVLSPIVPGLPGYQEASRMAGVSIDPKMASVFDFMVPLPSSAAAKVNLLGDNVGTDDALQRVIQIMTGGSYGVVDPALARAQVGYQSLYASGYRPPSIEPGKAFLIDGSYRPMTEAEQSKYAQLRGQYLKEELSGIGYTDDPKEVRQAYLRANARALSDIGASVASVETPNKAASSPAPALPTVASAQPVTATRALGGRSLKSRRPVSRRLSSVRGPSLRHRGSLRLPVRRRSSLRRRR